MQQAYPGKNPKTGKGHKVGKLLTSESSLQLIVLQANQVFSYANVTRLCKTLTLEEPRLRVYVNALYYLCNIL